MHRMLDKPKARDVTWRGKKEKARPISQALNDMMQESKKQKAGMNRSGQNKNDYKQNDSRNRQEETNYSMERLEKVIGD